jgi:UDP-2-acetamido-3-amino-2,3-dideoxy-glucuronate N-acetyltransferase
MPEAQFSQHPLALVESRKIGTGTRIWAMAHVLSGAVVGEDCNICDHTFIENDVTIGNRVTIKCGVYIWDGVTIEDDVFIGPNATFTNDPFPRSKNRPAEYSKTIVKRGASIGANATLLPGISIGERAMVGAGSVVTRSVPPLAIVAGNPARIVGYEGAPSPRSSPAAISIEAGIHETQVPGVMLHRLTSAADLRGSLASGEVGKHIPFDVRRFFLVHKVPSKQVRGEHAHRTLHQFLVCINGRCSVLADDGTRRQEFLLEDPTIGLHIPPLVWAVQYKYSADAVLLVVASAAYDPADYIRDYSEFLHLVQGKTVA